MNKRIKKKHSFRKVVYIVKPGISDNPEECPTYKAYSHISLLKVIDKLMHEYDCEFLFMRNEYPYEKYSSNKGR